MKKRLVCMILTALLALSAALPAFALSSYKTDPSKLKGSDFTDVPSLSATLDRIFAGGLHLYTDIRCTQEASAPAGSRGVPPGKTYYVKSPAGNVYSGTSCYIYANAVYATLFGDVPFHGDDVGWINSEKVASNLASASYEAFRSAGVGFGALLRTTSNKDGSYNGNFGHSIIILKYDGNGITFLEGNGDGNGLVRVTTRDWAGFNSASVSGRGYKISFIVQPTRAYMDALYTGGKVLDHDFVGYFRNTLSYAGRFRDVPGGAWYADGVRTAYETGMIKGVTPTEFAPEGRVTVAEAVTLTARFLSLYYADGYVFKGTGEWYRPYYDYCAAWGIDTGFSDPDAAITRAEFARLMARALPDPAASGGKNVVFPDVPNGAPYAKSVEKLAGNGIICGTNGLFMPNGDLTRAQMAVIVARMADRNQRLG